MMLLGEVGQCRGARARTRLKVPETRPSFLDPDLANEPFLDVCRYEQILILYVLNRPIALVHGSSLDHASLSTLLNQLRHRCPRQH